MTGDHPVAGRYSFTTFEEYCQERWEMSLRRSQELIETADAVSRLQKHAELRAFLPARESHVRALLALDKDDERAEVWQRGGRP